jgi:hypothetical protein
MKSLCKFACTVLLTLSAFTFTPTQVAAQETRGSFTLKHEVRWQNIDVPAGEYAFSLQPIGGASHMLMLRPTSGKGTGFMMMVNDTEESPSSDLPRLLLVSRSGVSYVSTMKLPESGVVLHFNVPPAPAEKQVAAAGSGTVVATAR